MLKLLKISYSQKKQLLNKAVVQTVDKVNKQSQQFFYLNRKKTMIE